MYDLSQYKKIRVEPLAGLIGAEISDVDVTRIDEETFAEIHRAFLEHFVIFFRDQVLDEQSLAAFAERFGPLTNGYGNVAKPEPGVAVTSRRRAAETPRTVRNLGARWHADQSSREAPTKGILLYCQEAPPYGGDTLFASLCAAYDDLAPALKTVCDPLIALHSLSGVFGSDGMGGVGTTWAFNAYNVAPGKTPDRPDEATLATINRRFEHPLVCTHPDTGRPILYLTGNHVVGIKGMNDVEARPLLELLNNHVVRPEFTCRFRWKQGSLAVWDNRCLQHYAVTDYEGFPRSMLRTELKGTRPYGPAMPREAGPGVERPLQAANGV